MSISLSSSRRTLSIASVAIPQRLGEPVLYPVRLFGTEGVNSLFAYELLLKTPNLPAYDARGVADLDLDGFIGREISCRIELDGRGPLEVGTGERQINALITEARMLDEDGRHVRYQFTLRPWLHLATLETDCRTFQNKTVVEILDELLADYPFVVEKRLRKTYPARDFQNQFNESDFAFFERLCQEWGLSYHFEHGDDKQRLVIGDAMGAYRPGASAACQTIDYHPPGWKTDAEYIHSFTPASHLTSGTYSTGDYDYSRPRADLRESHADPRPTGQAHREVYLWHGGESNTGPTGLPASHFAQPRAGTAAGSDLRGEGRKLAMLRMQALRTHASRAQGRGNLRAMVPGCTFQLAGHPRRKANAEYLILETTLLIEDVAQDSQFANTTAEGRQQWRVKVDFVAHPTTEDLLPATTRARPGMGGPQTALVVGPEGHNLWTDDLGRIKVQFFWDRKGRKDEHSSCWIRVSSPDAGNQQGMIHTPRIGQEVVVSFLGGDPDLPLCTGSVHNQNNLPSWTLPSQSALSGIRTRELTPQGGNGAAGRSNFLALDDSAGRIQVQLQSDHQHSSLALGAITRIEGNAGLKDPRGQGFELRTDGHGVVRAADGLLMSSEACRNAAGHAKDLGEAMTRLAIARDLVEGQATAARTSRAQVRGDQDAVAQALKKLNDTIKGSGGNPQKGEFPELAEPHVVLASPSGMALTSGGSTHIASVDHTQLTSSGHTSVNSGQSLFVVALQAFKAYAMEHGMEMVAAQADIDIRALQNSIRLSAKDRIELTADEISITAKTRRTLNGGTSYGEFQSGRIVSGTTGTHTRHAGTHGMAGADSRPTRPVDGEACGVKEAMADAGASSVARS